jgi:tetratricopeptide (TPR) repeat protein
MVEMLMDIFKEEEELAKKIQEAKKQKDWKQVKKLKLDLVSFYVHYGEHFKMSDRANPDEAMYFLEKAVKMVPNHAIANYRLAHLYYRQNLYEKAALHFRTAIDSSTPTTLNDIQSYLAHLFLANSGILIAKNIVPSIEKWQVKSNVEDDPLVEKYRHELLVTSEKTMDRLFYQKVTRTQEELIPYEDHFILMDENPNDTVLLIIDEAGAYHIKLGEIIKRIHFVDFLLIYTILMCETSITNERICEKLFNYNDPEHGEYIPNETKIRRELSRLKEEIPFWDELIETRQIGKKKRPKFKTGHKIFCTV